MSNLRWCCRSGEGSGQSRWSCRWERREWLPRGRGWRGGNAWWSCGWKCLVVLLTQTKSSSRRPVTAVGDGDTGASNE